MIVVDTWIFVVCRGARAAGVEFRWNKRFLPDADGETHTVRARRLVVLSAGSFGSPGILERSGIGAADVLSKNAVKQVVDLPGVGEGYQGVWTSSLEYYSIVEDVCAE